MKKLILTLMLVASLAKGAQFDFSISQETGAIPATYTRTTVIPDANGVIIFSAGKLPMSSLILPSAVQGNITQTGTLIGGATGSGFTLNFSASTMSGVIPIVNLATGTPDGTKFIRDDGTLQSIPGGGDALTANPLSQFAATTSLQLKNTLSDELGAVGGKVIFAEGTLVIPSGDTLIVPAGGGTLDSAAFTSSSIYVTKTGILALGGFSSITGILPVANFATGTPTGTKFVRDDGVLAVPAGTASGDVVGPALNDENFIPQWDSVNSKILKNGLNITTGSATLSDDGGKVPLYSASTGLGAAIHTSFGPSGSFAKYQYNEIIFFQASGSRFGTFNRPPVMTDSGDWFLPEAYGTLALTTDIPVKAWVNFDGTTAANVSGTYNQAGTTTVTVTSTAHGHLVGHVVFLDFTSGGISANDALFTIATVVDANNYTVVRGASTTTSGNVTELRRAISGSSGVHSVTYENSAGLFYVNFTSTFTDANYTVGGTAGFNGTHLLLGSTAATKTTAACELRTYNGAPTLTNFVGTGAVFTR